MASADEGQGQDQGQDEPAQQTEMAIEDALLSNQDLMDTILQMANFDGRELVRLSSVSRQWQRLIYSNKTVWTQALNRVISTPGPLRNSLSFIESWASTSDFFCYDRDVEYLFRPPLQMSPCGIVLSQVTNPLLSLDASWTSKAVCQLYADVAFLCQLRDLVKGIDVISESDAGFAPILCVLDQGSESESIHRWSTSSNDEIQRVMQAMGKGAAVRISCLGAMGDALKNRCFLEDESSGETIEERLDRLCQLLSSRMQGTMCYRLGEDQFNPVCLLVIGVSSSGNILGLVSSEILT